MLLMGLFQLRTFYDSMILMGLFQLGTFIESLKSIIELFDLEGIVKGCLLCCVQGHQQIGQVAQSLVQPDLKCLQGWGATTSLGNLCQCLTTLSIKNIFLISLLASLLLI